jgi:mannitol 2-dehydrogenase
MRRVRAVDEQGRPIDVRHPLAALLKQKAEEGNADPAALLSIAQLFGDLAGDKRLVEPLTRWLTSLYDVGSLKTLERAASELGF